MMHILASDRRSWIGIMASGRKRRGWILHLVAVLTVVCSMAGPLQGDDTQAQMEGVKPAIRDRIGNENPFLSAVSLKVHLS